MPQLLMLLSLCRICVFWTCHTHGVTHVRPFVFDLFKLSMMFSVSTHSMVSISSLIKAELYRPRSVYSLIHQLLHLLAIVNNATLNIDVCSSICLSFLLLILFFLFIYLLILERERERERGRETSVGCSTYLCNHWLTLVCA